MTTDAEDTDRTLSIIDAAARSLIATDVIPGGRPSADPAWELSSWDTEHLAHAARYPERVFLGRPGIASLLRFAWDKYAQDALRRSRMPPTRPDDHVRTWADLDRP